MAFEYKPLSLISELQRELSKQFANKEIANFGTEEWAPAVDIRDEDKQYVIEADLPGVKAEDISVTVDNGVLTIKGERQSEKTEKRDNYKRVERFSGSFLRRFTLPEAIDPDNIKATTKDGVLELSVPKKEKSKPNKIEVKVKGK